MMHCVCESACLCFDGSSESFFFFNDTATTEIYTLSLHDALPISSFPRCTCSRRWRSRCCCWWPSRSTRSRGCSSCCWGSPCRSEEHTSELQSRQYLVCRLLLEKKKTYIAACTHRTRIYTTCVLQQ